MFKRQKSGAVLCRSCGKLVGVNDEKCLNCGHTNPALWGFAPAFRRLGQDLGFAPIVIGGCAALYTATLLVDPDGIRTTGVFSFLSPSMRALFMFGASGAVPVFVYDRWWTVLSAAWLHGGLLHIIFNMMWIRQLVPATAELYGPGRMMIIYTVAAISGFGLSTLAGAFFGSMPFSFLQGARFTIGASAPLFGLLGALVLYGRRSGSSYIRGQAFSNAAILFIFGLVMQGVDNYAHLGGFAGGYLTARVLDPLRPERVQDQIAGVVCIGLSAASILASLFHGFNLFR